MEADLPHSVFRKHLTKVAGDEIRGKDFSGRIHAHAVLPLPAIGFSKGMAILILPRLVLQQFLPHLRN